MARRCCQEEMDGWWGEVASQASLAGPGTGATGSLNHLLATLRRLCPASGMKGEVCSQGPALLGRCVALLRTNASRNPSPDWTTPSAITGPSHESPHHGTAAWWQGCTSHRHTSGCPLLSPHSLPCAEQNNRVKIMILIYIS